MSDNPYQSPETKPEKSNDDLSGTAYFFGTGIIISLTALALYSNVLNKPWDLVIQIFSLLVIVAWLFICVDLFKA